MSNANVVIDVERPDASEEGALWIKVIQEALPDETITLGETAELLDNVFAIDPCIQVETVEGEEPEVKEPSMTEEEFQEFVRTLEPLSICEATINYDYFTSVRVYVADFTKDYRLVLSNGVAETGVRTTTQETENILIEKTSSATLKYPSSGSGVYQWLTCIPHSGAANPPIREVNDGIEWDGEMTGTIVASYPTTYDAVPVTVFGVDGEYGECNVAGFYVGLVDEISLVSPDVDPEDEAKRQKYCGGVKVVIPEEPEKVYCYLEVTNIVKCQCSLHTHNIYTSKEPVTCPEGIRCDGVANTNEPGYECEYKVGSDTRITYVDCGETTGDIANPDFYEENCCEPPPFGLPGCSRRYVNNPGGKGLTEAKKQEFYRQYGVDGVVFEGISPEDGDCGDIIYDQSLIPRDCCEDVPSVSWDTERNPGFIATESSVYLYILNGLPPFTFTSSDPELVFDNGLNIKTTNGRAVLVYATADFCGSSNISVIGQCGSSSMRLRSLEGVWEFIPSETDTCNYPEVEPTPCTFVDSTPAPHTGYCYDAGDRRQFETTNVIKSHNALIPEAGRFLGGWYFDKWLSSALCPTNVGQAICSPGSGTGAPFSEYLARACYCAGLKDNPWLSVADTCMSFTEFIPEDSTYTLKCDPKMWASWTGGGISIDGSTCDGVSGSTSSWETRWYYTNVLYNFKWVCA